MVKFKGVLIYKQLADGEGGAWTFETTPLKGGTEPADDRDIAALLRNVADSIDRRARQKLN